MEHTGLLGSIAHLIHQSALPGVVLNGALIALSAVLSALMSNTATATMLIPLAAALDPGDVLLPILIALGCSLGMPFAISTPANAMAIGAGVPPRALLRLSLPIMILGVILLSVGGSTLLRWLGA